MSAFLGNGRATTTPWAFGLRPDDPGVPNTLPHPAPAATPGSNPTPPPAPAQPQPQPPPANAHHTIHLAHAERPPTNLSRGPPPGLMLKHSKVAIVLFMLYLTSLLAYIIVRIWDIVTLMPTSAERGYSAFILAVELMGASALLPYALINTRRVVPTSEPENPKQTYEDFGCHSQFDVFVVIPCYKESWKTIKRTLMCAMFARLPPGCRKHIILGDDGHDVPQTDPAYLNCSQRAARVQKLRDDMRAMYPDRPEWFYAFHVAARPKKRSGTGKPSKIEGNAKSLNLNYCIKCVIPRILQQLHTPHSNNAAPKLSDFSEDVLHHSVVVVLDCDMAIHNDTNESQLVNTPPRNGDGLGFFPKILRVLEDDSIDLVLSPQSFTNVSEYADAFNHSNPQFWEYILPGLTALGYVACTGTNMGLRLSMLAAHSKDPEDSDAAPPFCPGQSRESAQYEAAMQGPFPVYSVTEDYALSLELKKAGFKGTYICEYLVRGEAPHGIQAVDIQRGRWTEGHWQIYWTARNPVFALHKLGLLGATLYNYGTWAYLCNILTIWVYQVVPLLSAFGIQPVAFSENFRVVATMYLISVFLVQYYVRDARHFFGMWRANMSNVLLSWTYMKAIARAALRRKSGFATHTEACDQPADELQAQPPMAEPPCDSLASEKVQDIVGHVLYFLLLLLLSFAAVIATALGMVTRSAPTANCVLPLVWALYNAIGPILFFSAAFVKKTKSLELAMCTLYPLHTILATVALVSMWFVNKNLTIELQ